MVYFIILQYIVLYCIIYLFFSGTSQLTQISSFMNSKQTTQCMRERVGKCTHRLKELGHETWLCSLFFLLMFHILLLTSLRIGKKRRWVTMFAGPFYFYFSLITARHTRLGWRAQSQMGPCHGTKELSDSPGRRQQDMNAFVVEPKWPKWDVYVLGSVLRSIAASRCCLSNIRASAGSPWRENGTDVEALSRLSVWDSWRLCLTESWTPDTRSAH